MTVEAFLTQEWLPRKKTTVRSATYDSYLANIRLHINPAIGRLRLQALHPNNLEALYAELSAKGLSLRTVSYLHVIIRMALQDARKRRLTSENVAGLVDPPRHQKQEMKTWTADELRTFLSFVEHDTMYPALLLSAMTGMRRGEVLGLRWEDVDFNTGRIAIVRQLTTGLQLAELKPSRSRRSVPLDPRTLAVLRTHRVRQAERRLASGSAWPSNNLVFTTQAGLPLHPDTYTHLFDRRRTEVGLRHIRLHDLRHTYATLSMAIGTSGKVVSEILGHSSFTFTVDTYSHVTPSVNERAAHQLGEFVLGARDSL